MNPPIVVVNQRDRGFSRVGPTADSIATGIRAAMEQRGYESEVVNNEIWVRYRARRTGFPQPYARVLAACQNDPAGAWNVGWVGGVDARYDQAGQVADRAQCQQMIANAAGDPDFRFLYWLDGALRLCRRQDRATFVGQDFLPAFFGRFPNGRVIFIGTDSQFESRLPLLRIGNYHQINGRAAYEELANNGIRSVNTAVGIHSSGVVALDVALTALLGNFMPLRTHLVGGRFGFHAVYLFGQAGPPVIDRGPFPRSEVDLHTANVFQRGDDPDPAADPADPLGGWLGRFRNTLYPGDGPAEALVRHLIERFNWHLENRLEVCNFVDNDTIDFIECFEKYLTIDRIFHECVMVATATSSATARLMTFAVLDKFQELCRFPGVPAGRGFHYMCTRPFLNAVLLPAFGTLPAPWDAYFRDKATALYDDLYSVVRSARGVWPSFLVQPGGGVRVYRRWDQNAHQFVNLPAPLSDDDFVAEYVRSARNTHHGYLSDGDNRRRFACFGSISTAFLPDSFTQLPLLILLAEIVSPQLLSGHHWLDQGALVLNV